MLNPTPKKCCRVCGDKALAFNFNGLSCESCKAFFRRNVLLLLEDKTNFYCKFNNNCEINFTSRKICRKCRMDKCIKIGMQQQLINTRNKSTLQIDSKSSSKYEQNCLELVRKSKYLFHEPSQLDHIKITGFVRNMTQVISNQQYLIEDIISFGKSIPGFAQLKPPEQLTTFRSAFSRILLLRSAYYFDLSKNCFIQRTDPLVVGAAYVNLDIVYGLEDKHDAIEQHRLVAYMAKEEIREDHIIRDLLSAILMFNKTNNCVSLEYSKYQYFLHCQLLQKYLLNTNENNFQIVNQRFRKLMKIVDEIEIVEQNVQSMLHSSNGHIDLSKIPHVLSEIYQLG